MMLEEPFLLLVCQQLYWLFTIYGEMHDQLPLQYSKQEDVLFEMTHNYSL